MQIQSEDQLSKELKFGNVMVKRAKRELRHLEAKIQQCHVPEQVSDLRLQSEELERSLAEFEQELFQLQAKSAHSSVS